MTLHRIERRRGRQADQRPNQNLDQRAILKSDRRPVRLAEEPPGERADQRPGREPDGPGGPKNTLHWTDRAACKDADPALFFPMSWDAGPGGPGEQARRICQACPVQAACLDWAVRTGEPDGIWGGTTPEERRRLRVTHGLVPGAAPEEEPAPPRRDVA